MYLPHSRNESIDFLQSFFIDRSGCPPYFDFSHWIAFVMERNLI